MCQGGALLIDIVSQELLAQVLLATALDDGRTGLTLHVMDGIGSVEEEVKQVVTLRPDIWTGLKSAEEITN
jgi:hypothetical protein